MKPTHIVPALIAVLLALPIPTRTAQAAQPPDLIAAVTGDTAGVKKLLHH